MEWDGKPLLYFMSARYYAPFIGRFITMDPLIGSPQDPPSLHRYTYATNNPINIIDPEGLGLPILAIACLVGAIIAIVDSILDIIGEKCVGWLQATLEILCRAIAGCIGGMVSEFLMLRVLKWTSEFLKRLIPALGGLLAERLIKHGCRALAGAVVQPRQKACCRKLKQADAKLF